MVVGICLYLAETVSIERLLEFVDEINPSIKSSANRIYYPPDHSIKTEVH